MPALPDLAASKVIAEGAPATVKVTVVCGLVTVGPPVAEPVASYHVSSVYVPATDGVTVNGTAIRTVADPAVVLAVPVVAIAFKSPEETYAFDAWIVPVDGPVRIRAWTRAAAVTVSDVDELKLEKARFTVNVFPSATRTGAIVTDAIDVAFTSAAEAGTVESRPNPIADTATSAMRLRSVFVDICFLSISRSEEFPPFGFG
jgi:hypothetical protein